ncbi:MAG: helix-turn-helix domain-containing protein [Hyphomicrobiaceae bacterium]
MILDALTAEQVAEALGCTPEHVNELASAHKIPAVKFGRSWRYPAAAVNAFLAQQAMSHIEPPARLRRAVTVSGKPGLPDLTRAIAAEFRADER